MIRDREGAAPDVCGLEVSFARSGDELVEAARDAEQVERLDVAHHRHDEADAFDGRRYADVDVVVDFERACRSSGCSLPAPL